MKAYQCGLGCPCSCTPSNTIHHRKNRSVSPRQQPPPTDRHIPPLQRKRVFTCRLATKKRTTRQLQEGNDTRRCQSRRARAMSFRSTAHPYHQEAPSTTTTSRSPLDPHLGIATTNDRERFRATRCHTPHRRDNHVDCHSRPQHRHSCPETPPSVHIVMHPLWQKEHKASPSTPSPVLAIGSESTP